MINTHNHAHAEQCHHADKGDAMKLPALPYTEDAHAYHEAQLASIAELEQEVKVLNAQIKAMKPFLIYEECNTDFRRIAENEVK